MSSVHEFKPITSPKDSLNELLEYASEKRNSIGSQKISVNSDYQSLDKKSTKSKDLVKKKKSPRIVLDKSGKHLKLEPSFKDNKS